MEFSNNIQREKDGNFNIKRVTDNHLGSSSLLRLTLLADKLWDSTLTSLSLESVSNVQQHSVFSWQT